jgi:prepilin-type N-terminal cleavage/methylation domain-containing protein
MSDGYSLLEVIIALAIVSLTLFVTFNINSNSISLESSVRQRLTALFEAEKLLNSKVSVFPERGITTGEITGGHTTYTYTVKVNETPHPDAEEITVTIQWIAKGNTKSITLVGLAYR